MDVMMESKDGILQGLKSDESVPRMRRFRPSVRNLRRLRAFQSEVVEDDPRIPFTTASPRTRRRLLRILRTPSFNSSPSLEGSDGLLPPIPTATHCSLPLPKKNNPCFTMNVDENPFSLSGGADETSQVPSTISSLTGLGDSALLHRHDPVATVSTFIPVEILVPRPRIPTEEWQDSWIRDVSLLTPSPQVEEPTGSSKPTAPTLPSSPRTVIDTTQHGTSIATNRSKAQTTARPRSPPNRTKSSPSRFQRPLVASKEEEARTACSKPPRMTAKAQTVPCSVMVADDHMEPQRRQLREPGIIYVGNLVGESAMAPASVFSGSSSSPSSSSLSWTDRRRIATHQSSTAAKGECTGPLLRLPEKNVDVRDDHEEHPMKVFETFFEDHARKKTPFRNDLDYYWRQTKRWSGYYPGGVKPVDLQRNQSGCLT